MNTQISNKPILIFFPAFLLALAIFLAYSNSFHSPFYFDDYGYVVGNSPIEISSLSFENLKGAALKSPLPKRVLPNISFALNHYFWGPDVFSFHLVNLFLHWLTALAVFYLFKTTLGLPIFQKSIPHAFEISLVAALLWACHPLQTNAVTYIVQRMTCMATFFTITALLCYVKGRVSQLENLGKGWLWFSASFLSMFMALLSKENSAMLPFLLIAFEIFFVTDISWKKDGKKIILLLATGLSILSLLAYIYLDGNMTSFLNYSSRTFTLEERLLTEMRVVIFYLSLFALPLPSRLTLFHDIPISHGLFAPLQTFFALLLLILLATAVVFFFKRARLLSFAILWYLANLLIESSIIPLEIIYEHRTYLPTIFFSLVLVFFLYRTTQAIIISRSVGAVLLCLLILFTWQRNVHWSDSALFWEDAALKAPNVSRTHMGAYFSLKKRGHEQEAFEALKKAFYTSPENVKAMAPLVETYNRQKQYNASLAVINKHLSIRQTAEGYIERAKVNAVLNNMAQALSDTEQALLLKAKSNIALLIKGKALSVLGKQNKALEAFSEAQKNGLDNAILYISIGEVYINSGRTELAIHYFNKGIEKDPDNASGHYYLGLAYGKAGRKEEARREMALGIELREKPVQKSSNPHNF